MSSELEEKFNSMSEEIELHRAHGAKVINCPECSFQAAIEEPGFSPIFFSHCLLCKTKARYVRMKCHCELISPYDGASNKACKGCSEIFTYSLVVQQNEPKVCGEEEPDSYQGAQAHCHICRKQQDSVFEFDHQWLCLNCLEEHRAPGCCEECETVQTGDIEDSFESGCIVCSGRISWD